MDHQQFEEFLQACDARRIIHGRCLQIIHKYPAAEQTAEDLTQIALIKIWRKVHDFRGEAAPSSWIYRIATNTALDYLRRNKKKAALTLSLDMLIRHEEGETRLVDAIEEIVNHTEEKYIASLDSATLLAHMDTLPKIYRDPALLRVLDYSLKEISHIVGSPLGTVKSRLNRAYKITREQLERQIA